MISPIILDGSHPHDVQKVIKHLAILLGSETKGWLSRRMGLQGEDSVFGTLTIVIIFSFKYLIVGHPES